MSPYAMALLFGVGVIVLQIALLYQTLGREWFDALIDRTRRRLAGQRPDDDDDTDYRGIGGGCA